MPTKYSLRWSEEKRRWLIFERNGHSEPVWEGEGMETAMDQLWRLQGGKMEHIDADPFRLPSDQN